MHNRRCQKGQFEEQDINTIHEAIFLAGLDAGSIAVESDRNFVNIDNSVEIQPVLFDCRGALETPSWIVRSLTNPAASEPCSCGIMTRGGEVGTYTVLRDAIAAAIAEVVRLKVMANLQDPRDSSADAGVPAAHLPKLFQNDFIRHSLHR